MYKILRAYWPSVRKYLFWLVVMCIAMVSAVIFGVMRPLFLREIVDVMVAPVADPASAKEGFLWFAGAVLMVFVSHRVFQHAQVMFEARVIKDLDERSFAAIQRQSIRFFEDAFAGSLMKSAIRFRNSFESITDKIAGDIGRSILIIIAVFSVMLYTVPSFALLFGVWTVVFLGFTGIFLKYKYPLDIANADADTAVGGAFIDSLSNHLTAKVFAGERCEQARFNTRTQESYQKRLISWLVSNAGSAIQGMLMIIAELGFVFWSITRWEQGLMGISDLVFLQSYVMWILVELRNIGGSVRSLFSAIAEAQEMADIYSLEPEVKDAPNAHPLVVYEGFIDIHGLSFAYGQESNGKDYVLNGVNIRIPAGQSVGLVGKTGAGKSTLVKLLMRLYDLHSGYIRIDMQDIATVTQESLRQQIAMVSQQPQLFHRSIRDNIAFARPDATDDEIVEAARQAGVLDFIEGLPDGFQTMVGERGVKLSGGQCQRIAIARAFLADPRILILDEATSSQDSETEKDIQQAISDLLKGGSRTLIAIAHRLSTLMSMDRIIVIDDGKVLEDGTHEELLKRDGLYARLWRRQSGGYIALE